MNGTVWHIRYVCLAAILSLVQFCGYAQEKESFSQFVQLNSIFSDGSNAPFWLTANRQGLFSLNNFNGYLRYGAALDGGFGKRGAWRYRIAGDIVAGYNRNSMLSVQELYAELSWKWLTLNVGSKERRAEMRDYCDMPMATADGNAAMLHHLYGRTLGELGTGGLLYSGNSAPVPQVRLEVPEFVDVAGTKSWLKLRGHIAYGIFLDYGFQEKFTSSNPTAKYARNVLYHSKALFMKVGNTDRFPLEVEGGLEMYSQFGGDFYTHSKGQYLSMPRKAVDYLKAFIPLAGGESTPVPEQANISGNQIGNWHLAFNVKTRLFDVRLYGEHMFEDFSQLFFFEYQSNREGQRGTTFYPWRDMQVGISVTNKTGYLKFISSVQYEYTSMYNQSGACYNDPGPVYKEQMDGADNYYNHSIYPGWHYYGMGIGNPLAISPLYNSNGSLVFSGNRFKAHNVGINGAFAKRDAFKYRLMYTYSENWGTYFNPFVKKMYTTSLLADLLYLTKSEKWVFAVSLAYDRSNYIGNNWGAMLSIARVGLFKEIENER